MESNKGSDTSYTQRDLPIWARALAAGLLLFASWWLFNTDAIRSAVGDSVGALCLGVIAASLIQGMHLPFGLWPDGPWRKRFSVPAVVATAAVIALMILTGRAVNVEVLIETVDLGTGIAVVAGAVGLGFSVGFVKQRRYLAWYLLAIGLALLPLAGQLLFEWLISDAGSTNLCVFSLVAASSSGTSADGCGFALLPALIFLTAVGATTKAVTEEIAFRRILIGVTPGAGLLPVIGSACTALLWYALLFKSGVGDVEIIVWGTLGAVSAGCIFVLSKSLLVSALFSAVYTSGYWSLTFAAGADSVTGPAWTVASMVSFALAVFLSRRNGFFGNLREAASTDVTRS